VRELAQWIREQLTLMLDEVPFDREDPTLVPEAGSCSTCSKRTGFNQALWDDFKEDRCLDAQCYNGKLKEHIARQLQNNSNLIQISACYSTTDKNTLTRDRYTIIEQPKEGTEPSRSAEKTCEHASQAIVVEGGKRGEVLNVCAETACPIHNAPTNRTTEGERKQQQQQWKREQELRDKAHQHNRQLLDAVVKKAPAILKRADLEMVVLAFIESLSIDDFEALAEQYKVDTEKVRTDQGLADLLRQKARSMTEQQLVRALIQLALLPFGHSYKELPADNPLVLAAKRYGATIPKAKTAAQKKCGSSSKATQTTSRANKQTESRNAPKSKAVRKGGAA
jgi:ParB family chromosome partitioning protein